MDSMSVLLSAGFSLDDLSYIKSSKTESVSYEEYIEVIASQIQAGKSVKQIKIENDIPFVYAETKEGELVRGYEGVVSDAPDEPIALKTDSKGKPLCTIENFLEIFRHDPHYDHIRFNEITNRPEHGVVNPKDGTIKFFPWDDEADSRSRHYCETCYGIYNKSKHDDAMRIRWGDNKVNPILEMLEQLPPWDGESRCMFFLQKWLKVHDSRYTRAVGQILFDSAVSRAYIPGCKYDTAVVLIGEKAGEGKSTIIRLLAINEEYYGEIKDINASPDSIFEDMSGKWIIEISEYCMSDSQKLQDKTKAFISRREDTHRVKYDKYPNTIPRRCTFVASTNYREFLSNSTAERKWLPIITHSDGSFVRDDTEIREDIKQCYAEALARFRAGNAMLYLPDELQAEARERQDLATIQDERYGLIEEYCSRPERGEYICTVQIFEEVLKIPPEKVNATLRRQVKELMRKIPYLEEEDKPVRMPFYGPQRAFKNLNFGKHKL